MNKQNNKVIIRKAKKEDLNKEEKIINFLQETYGAEAIIIVGSRAVGDFNPASDWDIYIFSKKKERKFLPKELKNRLPNSIKEEDLDIYVNNFDEKTYTDKLYRDLRNARIVLDKNSFGKKLVDKSKAIYKDGPKRWTRNYAQWRLNKAQRYMKKFNELLKDKKYPELFLRISWYYDENLLEWWFGIRQEFRLRPQQAFPYIKNIDPKFYKQLKIITSDKFTYKKKVKAIEECNKILFNKKEFKNLIK